MAAVIGVRTDQTSEDLRDDATKFAGVTLQIVRDWVLRFSVEGLQGLSTRKAPRPRIDPGR
jgi:transposase